jgi:hypothetical protein
VSYDGKPAPSLGTHLNLNALLAFLSTILRALLVVIVSQIICQQKWDWYSDSPSPLLDLQRFDSGSRGSLGALLLLPTVILKDAVALLAAAVLVVSFLIGPFVQQASRTSPCLFPAPGLNASLPYAHYVPRRGGLSLMTIGDGASIQGALGDPLPSPAVAILSSVTAPNGTENQIHRNCATGTYKFGDADYEEGAPTFLIDKSFSTHSTVAMCDRCIDVVSLVSRNHTPTDGGQTTFMLPNGISLTHSWGPSAFAVIRPSAGLRWLGDLLTPELRAISRWAYINTTFLTISDDPTPLNQTKVTAAVCVLYPCVRTYAASITNNLLSEQEVSSQVMEISVQHEERVNTSQVTEIRNGRTDWWGSLSAQEQYEAHYAAVKSPCLVGGQVYDENLNTTSLNNAISLSLYDFTDPSRITYRNISAPEFCILRHDVQFVKSISTFLHKEIFNGSCSWWKGNNCGKAGNGYDVGPLSHLGARMVLEKLIEGERAYFNVTSWFSAFANAMTNRFRFEFGAAAFDTSIPLYHVQPLPLGEDRGIAWQTETCVSTDRNWLALPIALTAITTLLMLWTIAHNWRHRRTRPVWKDNLLPLLFYRHNIQSEKQGALPWRPGNITKFEHRAQLMETSEMEKVGKGTLVTFQWSAHRKLDDALEGADDSVILLHDVRRLPTQRREQEADGESLLARTGTRHYRARSTSQTW